MTSRTADIVFAGHTLTLDASGALWWAQEGTLVVSDMHLEKSTFLASYGSLVAPYDTVDTLERLEALVQHYAPRQLILLGDSFHDRGAWLRLDVTLRTRIEGISARVQYCRWIEGNHDMLLTANTLEPFEHGRLIGGIGFSHELEPVALPQIIGHYHPKATISIASRRLRGKCFLHAEDVLVMPAFGSYTGGLDIRHEAFAPVLRGQMPRVHFIYGQHIYPVSPRPAQESAAS